VTSRSASLVKGPNRYSVLPMGRAISCAQAVAHCQFPRLRAKGDAHLELWARTKISFLNLKAFALGTRHRLTE